MGPNFFQQGASKVSLPDFELQIFGRSFEPGLPNFSRVPIVAPPFRTWELHRPEAEVAHPSLEAHILANRFWHSAGWLLGLLAERQIPYLFCTPLRRLGEFERAARHVLTRLGGALRVLYA